MSDDKPPLQFVNPPQQYTSGATALQPPGKDPVSQYINQLVALANEKSAQQMASQDHVDTLGVESDRINFKTASASATEILDLRDLISAPPSLPEPMDKTQLILVSIGIFAIGFFILKGKI